MARYRRQFPWAPYEIGVTAVGGEWQGHKRCVHVGSWALLFSAKPTVFLAANCEVAITWAFVIPHLLGVMAQLGNAGQMAAQAGFTSKMGFASGPLVAGLMLGYGNFPLLINLGAAVLAISMLAGFVSARITYRYDR